MQYVWNGEYEYYMLALKHVSLLFVTSVAPATARIQSLFAAPSTAIHIVCSSKYVATMIIRI